MNLCHSLISGHVAMTKTKDKLLRYFFWPNIIKEAEAYVKSCDPCQKIGKAGEQKKAPLKLVPIITAIFTHINCDIVGPLPPSENQNKYMLTAMCLASRYPEAIPIPDSRSETVIDALMIVFSRMGFPKVIQTDLGACFMSNLTSTFLEKFGIKITHSSVHHPQTNCIERWHRSVKRLLKVICLESGESWERSLPYALLALRTVTHESTGFSPAELVHGRNLRTPETLLFEKWTEQEEEQNPVTEYVFELINRLQRCQELAGEQMEEKRDKRKIWYDRNAVNRKFNPGDKVLVLATSKPNKLSVSWIGPGTIESQMSETNYIVNVPDRREKSQIYHVNLLKPYVQRAEIVNVLIEENRDNKTTEADLEIPYPITDPEEFDLNMVIRDSNLGSRCTKAQQEQLGALLIKHKKVFSNIPGRTNLIEHDIELTSDKPVRMKPYRTSPRQTDILKSEIQRMLELGIIKEGESDYTSPMILVEALGREPRPCVDYRKLNEITRAEFFPLPNIEERVEQVAASKFITVIDLTKGYWQIPLTPNAQRLATFVTSFGSYQPLVMPFGLVSAPYRFSKFMSILLKGLESFCLPYLDDMAIFSNSWEEHLEHLDIVLKRVTKAKLTIKLAKCKFAQETVKYLGHVVGKGRRKPSEIKIKAITDFPAPKSKTEIRRFLGMCGYYSRYIKNYAIIVEPLTRALKGKTKKEKVDWSPEMEKAFRELKDKLTRDPVLYAPDYTKEFIIQSDASDKGIGIIMAQRQGDEEHPILYLSRKFTKAEKNYSTTEKECAGIIFAVKKLKHYLDGQKFTIETDHNPLIWLKRNAGNNPRLMRWALTLQPFNYEIRHRPGKDIPHVDCLSRVD